MLFGVESDLIFFISSLVRFFVCFRLFIRIHFCLALSGGGMYAFRELMIDVILSSRSMLNFVSGRVGEIGGSVSFAFFGIVSPFALDVLLGIISLLSINFFAFVEIVTDFDICFTWVSLPGLIRFPVFCLCLEFQCSLLLALAWFPFRLFGSLCLPQVVV